VASRDNKGLRKHGDFDLLLFVDGTRDIDPDKFLVSAFKTSEIPSVPKTWALARRIGLSRNKHGCGAWRCRAPQLYRASLDVNAVL